MDGSTKQEARIRRVQQVFEDYDFGNAEILAGWDGRDVEELLPFLSEEEYLTLLDKIEEEDDGR